MAAKKQTKADKAFIEKIGTIGISTGASKMVCPDCGHESAPIGFLSGVVNGKEISGAVYGYPGVPMPPRGAQAPAESSSDEQSLSA